MIKLEKDVHIVINMDTSTQLVIRRKKFEKAREEGYYYNKFNNPILERSGKKKLRRLK